MRHAFVLAALFGAATVQANPTIETNGVLSNPDGRALYTFDQDSSGRSNCTGGCLAKWPAFTASDASRASGDFSIIVRDDGTRQWAFQGKPLYFFAGDSQPGEVKGDNVGGIWHALRSAPKTTARTYGAGSAGYSFTD